MNKPILVVMAAGMGSRYGGLKQMDPVGMNGEIIMDYSLFDAYQAGFRKVVFAVAIMLIVLFYRQGIMGTKEFSWEGFFRLIKSIPGRIKNLPNKFKSLFKKHTKHTKKVKGAQ